MDDDSTREDPISFGDARGGVIPPYRLLQKLGEGGMGEVWLAEQSEPVRRRVAIKVIKAGMDTKRVIARFEAERQALALMDHPAIARVFDAGETPRGLPYFAMEYVRGDPITAYCDRERLTNEARLRLFAEVCQGVQHAHQKGIIHRDLKPGNILVTIQDGRPVPKIIDFGVAKAVSQRLTEKTLYTEQGAMIGTPEYMSPEQAEMSGLDVDTRTDVYSLGVILYELLSGSPPFDSTAFRSAGFEEIRRWIREIEPPPPSVRVSRAGEASADSAAMRRTDPQRLASRLRGELDWIVMKAMEKNRTRRYESPSEMAADIARLLADEPVIARPPSAAYRARKFAKRHKFGVAVASLGIAGLAVFGVSMAIQARRTARERDRAERVSQFLTSLFLAANPIEARGKTVTARDILDQGVKRIEKELEDQPLVRAQLMITIGGSYRVLGLCADASRLLRSAVDTRIEALGVDDPQTLEAMSELGLALSCSGKLPEAETSLRQAVERSTRVLGPDHPTTLRASHDLAAVLGDLRRFDDAEALYRSTLARAQKTLGADDVLTLGLASDLASVVAAKDPREAVALVRDLLPRVRATLGEDHPLYIVALANLASDLLAAGDLSGAIANGEDALPRARRVMGDAAEVTGNVQATLAWAYFRGERDDEAEKVATSWIDNRRRAGGPDDPGVLDGMDLLSRVYSRQRRYAESERLRLELLASQRRIGGEKHPGLASSMYNLACVTALQKKRAEALDWLEQSVAHGFHDAEGISRDTDLVSLHGERRFEEDVAAARKKADGAPGR